MHGALVLVLLASAYVGITQKEVGSKDEKPDDSIPVYAGGALRLPGGTVARLNTADAEFMMITWE